MSNQDLIYEPKTTYIMSKDKTYFGYFSKSGKMIGVSKSDQSDAKFLKGAARIEKVEVQTSADYLRDLEVSETFGEVMGFLKATAMAGIGFLMWRGYVGIKRFFEKKRQEKGAK